VLHHEARRIPPVVEDLRPQNVPAQAPHVLVALLAQPLVAEPLRVEVVHLVAGVVHVVARPLEEEEAVVVDVLAAAIQMQEGGDVAAAAAIVHQVAGLEVEARCVEAIRLREVGHAAAEVAQLVHRRGAVPEALRAVDRPVLARRIVVLQLWRVCAVRCRRLAVHEVEREAVDGVAERHSLAAARSVQVVHVCRARKSLRGKFEVLGRLDDECSAAEFGIVALDGAVYEWLGAVALVEDAVRLLLDNCETKVQKELMGFIQVLVNVVDVGDTLQYDLWFLCHLDYSSSLRSWSKTEETLWEWADLTIIWAKCIYQHKVERV